MRTKLPEKAWLEALFVILGLASLILHPVHREFLRQVRPNAAEPQSRFEVDEKLDYRVLRFFSPPDRNHFSIIFVTIDPKHFNAHDMRLLAVQLNKEFADLTKLKAALLDDENTARLMAAGNLEPAEFDRRQRGLYYLDRSRHQEYIRFLSRNARASSKQTTIRIKP